MTKLSNATEYHSRHLQTGLLRFAEITHFTLQGAILVVTNMCIAFPKMTAHGIPRFPRSRFTWITCRTCPGLVRASGAGLWCNWWCWRKPCIRSLQAWSRICHVLIQHPCFQDLLSPPMLSQQISDTVSENTPEPSTFWSGAPAHLFCSQDKFKRPTIRMMRTRRVVGCFRLEQSHQLSDEQVIQSIRLVKSFFGTESGSETRKATSYQQTNLCAVCVLYLKQLLIHWIQKARKETTPLRWRFFVGGQKKTSPFFARPQDGSCEEVPVGWVVKLKKMLGIFWTPGASFFRGEIFSFREGTTSPA